MAGEQEVVAMVVVPSEYVHHINEVAGLTTSELIVIKRKFASTAGFELVRHPLDECTSVAYFDERSLMTLVSGVLLTALIALILVGLVLNWNELSAGTAVPIGALATAGVYGVTRVFGSRRHRFVFTMRDQATFTWASKAGELELWKPHVESIRSFARARRLLAA